MLSISLRKMGHGKGFDNLARTQTIYYHGTPSMYQILNPSVSLLPTISLDHAPGAPRGRAPVTIGNAYRWMQGSVKPLEYLCWTLVPRYKICFATIEGYV